MKLPGSWQWHVGWVSVLLLVAILGLWNSPGVGVASAPVIADWRAGCGCRFVAYACSKHRGTGARDRVTGLGARGSGGDPIPTRPPSPDPLAPKGVNVANATIVCRRAPVINRKQGVALWNEGDRACVEWGHFWQGMADQGRIAVIPSGEGGQQGLALGTEGFAGAESEQAGEEEPADQSVAPGSPGAGDEGDAPPSSEAGGHTIRRVLPWLKKGGR